MSDSTNIYTYRASVTNPGNTIFVQIVAPQYKTLEILRVEVASQSNLDEMVRLAIRKQATLATMASAPSWLTEVCPLDSSAVEPGFRAETGTGHGAPTGGSSHFTPHIVPFYSKVGGLWVPPYDPDTNQYKTIKMNYGEGWAVLFSTAPTNATWDFTVYIKEG